MKLAAIDIGSNSVHMIIAATEGARSFEVIDRVKEMVFLGRSVSESGVLTEEATQAGLQAVAKFHKLAQRHGVSVIRAVATAAVREAENGGEFLYAIAERTGISPQVISGGEEARFIYLAARNALDLSSKSALVLDIGGGSVEAIVGDAREMRFGHSLKLGVQKLRTRFGHTTLGKKQRKALEAHVEKLAGAALREARQVGFELVVGTSGTILALGEAAHRAAGGTPWTTPTGRWVSLDDLRTLTERLTALTVEQRVSELGIDAKRADSIHVGAVLLCRLLELANAKKLTLSDASLRDGVVLDYLERSAEDVAAWNAEEDIRRHSVLTLARRCDQTGPHPHHVARLALSIFDQTTGLHRLGDTERRLLEHASILHDIGQHIGYERHEQHAAYIIKNGDLRGFADAERVLIALLARYHRKSRPRRKDAEYAELGARQRRVVRILSGILRIADGLDRSHHQLVRALIVSSGENQLRIEAEPEPGADLELELWGARRKSKLWARELGREVEIVLGPSSGTGGDEPLPPVISGTT